MAEVSAWLSTSIERWYPRSKPVEANELHLALARGERASFQVCFKARAEDPVEVKLFAGVPDDLNFRVRRAGWVPVPHYNVDTPPAELAGVGHIPGYIPDVLLPETSMIVGPGETHSFWCSFQVPEDFTPGKHPLGLELRLRDAKLPCKWEAAQSVRLTPTLYVATLVLQPRKNFHVTHWFYNDALCDWYGVEPFEEKFWPICEAYMRNYVEHGLDTILVPIFTPPTDGVKRPTQLLRVMPNSWGGYQFDWRRVKQYIDLARECGIQRFEWTHLFTQWGAANAIRIYDRDGRILWAPETDATSKTYRDFLAAFLPSFEQFLRREGLMDQSFFHVSDEPHGEEHLQNYRKAREMLRELAPWMKVMDALSDIRYAEQGLTDIPVPSISVTPEFVQQGIPCWTYFCGGPRGAYLNRLMDTPLAKIRMSGWLFYRFRVLGFLHWGYNYWHKSQTQELIDPFAVSDASWWPRWSFGDPFVVYPGEKGPLDSIRWEVFAESLEDYRLLQTAEADPSGELLSSLHDFANFPKDKTWIRAMRRKLLTRSM